MPAVVCKPDIAADCYLISARLACMTSCFSYFFKCTPDFNHRSAAGGGAASQDLDILKLNSVATLCQSVRFDLGVCAANGTP